MMMQWLCPPPPLSLSLSLISLMSTCASVMVALLQEEQLYDDQGDLEEAVAAICQMAVLGSGDVDSVFPDLDLPETLAAAYSEETPWRIAL